MKLNEIAIVQPLSHQLRDWLDKVVIGTWTQRPDGLIDVTGDVSIPTSQSKILVRFGSVTGEFECMSCHFLESLEGSPLTANKFNCAGCAVLQSLEFAPRATKNFIAFNCSLITSFQGIQNHIDIIEEQFAIPETIKSHLFGVVFKKIGYITPSNLSIASAELKQACDIINRCLRGEISRIICQKELIQAGLGEFARM